MQLGKPPSAHLSLVTVFLVGPAFLGRLRCCFAPARFHACFLPGQRAQGYKALNESVSQCKKDKTWSKPPPKCGGQTLLPCNASFHLEIQCLAPCLLSQTLTSAPRRCRVMRPPSARTHSPRTSAGRSCYQVEAASLTLAAAVAHIVSSLSLLPCAQARCVCLAVRSPPTRRARPRPASL